jgi:hypothetical protein
MLKPSLQETEGSLLLIAGGSLSPLNIATLPSRALHLTIGCLGRPPLIAKPFGRQSDGSGYT